MCAPSLIIAGNNSREAVGSVDLAEFFVVLATVISFTVLNGAERFLWSVVIALVSTGLISAPIAASLCKRLPQM